MARGQLYVLGRTFVVAGLAYHRASSKFAQPLERRPGCASGREPSMAMPQASIEINASPEEVYAMISDLPSMGRWSPECYRCDWLGGATEAAPGVRFRGRNRIGIRRWSTTGTVAVAEPGRELSFDVEYYGMPVSRWTYKLEPLPGGGCRVTESTQDRRGTVVRTLGSLLLAGTPGMDRTARNQDTMQVTLERLKAAAEAGVRVA
jgi:uncharacterized protein YndB with AHSA1/START domain